MSGEGKALTPRELCDTGIVGEIEAIWKKHGVYFDGCFWIREQDEGIEYRLGVATNAVTGLMFDPFNEADKQVATAKFIANFSPPKPLKK